MRNDDFFEQLQFEKHKFLFQNDFDRESPQEDFLEFIQKKHLQNNQAYRQNCQNTVQADRNEQFNQESYFNLENHYKYSQQVNQMEQDKNIETKIVFSKEAREKRKRIIKGRAHDTDHLGLYFRIITLPVLRMIKHAKLIKREEFVKIKIFKSQSGSMESFKELFQNEGIRKFCHQYFSTNFIVKDILSHKKMDIKNKMMLLKYVKSLRDISYKPIKQWKPKVQE